MKLILLLFMSIITPINPKPFDAWPTLVYEAYKKNEVKADAKYLNRQVFLHGIVQYQSANMWTIYLAIPDPRGLPAGISEDDHMILKVPIYHPGDKFDLICNCAGKIMDLPLFLDCHLP